MTTHIAPQPHPLLDLGAFVAHFPAPLVECQSPPELLEAFLPGAGAPLASDDTIRAAVRDLLRAGGFKPTGRNKPASEYLQRAAAERSLAFINLAVDACNLCSLHSGLPMSVLDLDRTRPPLSVAIAPAGARYVFNSAGQVIDLGGLVCLSDADGPCANPVKDAQRTKTHPATRTALYLVWGTQTLGDRTSRTAAWCREILREHGVRCEEVETG
jgi:DNA/RNA-binding domain of Phe-tRNA-synthetase-like protein